ncbi:MAG: hypothetical protein HUU20_14495 [Pirellulales bacterium]|nr:hypothetical protein [Pirellulales bacterium]
MHLQRPYVVSVFAVIALTCASARGQRIQFPSPAGGAPAAAQGTVPVYTPPAATYVAPPVTVSPPPAFTPNAPSISIPPSAYAPAPSGAGAASGPIVVSPPPAASSMTPQYVPGQVPNFGPGISPGPAATFQGGIQPPPATWDPYATPGVQNPSLLPQDPYFPPPPGSGGGTPMTKFLQDIHLKHHWIPRYDDNGLGLNDSEVAATFAFPFLYNEQSPLLVTPGFGYQAWDGPKDPAAAMPPSTYEAFLELGWNPQPTPWLGGELAFGAGVFSDFSSVDADSVRYFGRGLLVLTFSPSFKIKGGIVYLDRVRVKLLPAGGIVWTPNSDVRFDIVFPDPKLAWRWTTVGNTEWWSYVRGEYGGGSWTVDHVTFAPSASVFERVDYNDLRAAVGLEWLTLRGFGGFVEVGIAFERELLFAETDVKFVPDPMVFVGGGIHF